MTDRQLKELTVAVVTLGDRNGQQIDALSVFRVGPDQRVYDLLKDVIAKDHPAGKTRS